MNFGRDLVVAVVLVLGLISVTVWAINKFLVEPSHEKYRAECAAVNGKAIWNGKHWECWR